MLVASQSSPRTFRCPFISPSKQWSGKVITNQALFSIFDALQVLLALATFNVVPVYKYIPRPQELTHASMSGQSIGLQKLNDDEDVQSEERV